MSYIPVATPRRERKAHSLAFKSHVVVHHGRRPAHAGSGSGFGFGRLAHHGHGRRDQPSVRRRRRHRRTIVPDRPLLNDGGAARRCGGGGRRQPVASLARVVAVVVLASATCLVHGFDVVPPRALGPALVVDVGVGASIQPASPALVLVGSRPSGLIHDDGADVDDGVGGVVWYHDVVVAGGKRRQ